MASREGFDLTNKWGRYNWNKRTWNQKPWRLMFEDTFMQFVCKVIGHNEYISDPGGDGNLACKRCHKWL